MSYYYIFIPNVSKLTTDLDSLRLKNKVTPNITRCWEEMKDEFIIIGSEFMAWRKTTMDKSSHWLSFDNLYHKQS